MKKFHIAISTNDIEKTVIDYSERLGAKPCTVIKGEYALWRTETLNVSIRHDNNDNGGSLRHLGWEDPTTDSFTEDTDVNGVVWEKFTAEQQADEINEFWPQANYKAK